MVVPLKSLLFLSLVLIAAAQQLETDYIHDPGESTREFIRDQNEVMRKYLKEEMQKMFATISKTLGEQLLEVTGKVETVDKKLVRNHQQVSRSISYLTTALFPAKNLTEVEEVNAEAGTIEFTGGTNPHLRTKIWVLQSKGGTAVRSMSFVLEENGLGEDARLSLWGSQYDDGRQHMWTGSEDNWREEKTNRGNVILVTLRVSPGAAETPSFKLTFNTTATETGYADSSQILGGKGRQEVSFPPNNTQNYPPMPNSYFVAVVAPPRGRSFRLTLKFIDLPGTPPDNCDNNYFYVWFLDENSTGFPFTQLPSSVYRRCGNLGAISEPLGNPTIAILQFGAFGTPWVDDGNMPVGKGFRVDVN